MQGQLPILKNHRVLLALILTLAFLLRFPGTFYGLPIFDRYAHIYHPDEGKVVEGAAYFPGDILTRSDLRYPTALHYFSGLLLEPIEGLITISVIPQSQHETLAYLVVRVVSLLYGVGAVALLYLFGKQLYDRQTGLLAAGLLAVTLYHVRNSTMATTDVATSFWLLVVLFFAYRLTSNSGWGDHLKLGVAMGMLVGTKYSGAIAVIPVGVIALNLLRQTGDTVQRWKILRLFGLGAIASLATFILTTPSILVNASAFAASLSYESTRIGGERVQLLSLTPLLEYARKLVDVAGWPMAVLAFLGLLYAIFQPKPRKALPLFWLVAGYLLYFWGALLSRYYILILPVFCLLAAWFSISLLRVENRPLRWAMVAALVLTFGYSFLYSLSGMLLLHDDTRSQAAAYIDTHFPAGASIGYEEIGDTFRGRWTLPYLDRDKYELIDNLDFPDYVILSSLRYAEFQYALASPKLSADYVWDPDYANDWYRGQIPDPLVFQFYDDILNGKSQVFKYRLITVFKKDIWAPIEFAPPEIRIYQRIDS